jgi:hypothetical protein
LVWDDSGRVFTINNPTERSVARHPPPLILVSLHGDGRTDLHQTTLILSSRSQDLTNQPAFGGVIGDSFTDCLHPEATFVGLTVQSLC